MYGRDMRRWREQEMQWPRTRLARELDVSVNTIENWEKRDDRPLPRLWELAICAIQAGKQEFRMYVRGRVRSEARFQAGGPTGSAR